MVLRTGCIYSAPNPEHGERVSVMRRHTDDEGKNPDPKIIKGISYQRWERELAAPGWLVNWWYKGNEQLGANKLLRWQMFERDYRVYLRRKDVLPKVKALAAEALAGDKIILCKEELPKFCHRGILADMCRQQAPELVVRHVI